MFSFDVFPGVEGQLHMAEQIKRFCVSAMPMEMERLRPKSSKVPVEYSVISTQHIRFLKTERFKKIGKLEMMKL